MGLGRHPSRRPWVRADDRWVHHRATRSFARGRDDRRRAREHLGLTGRGRPAARLFASLPGLEYPRRVWPADAHLVGPLAWDPPEVGVAPWPGPGQLGAASVDEVLARIDPAGPPVVVAADSTGTGATGGLAALAIEALAGLDLQLIAITHRRDVALEAAQRWPLGCVVASLPHHRALELAAVAVAPGGAGFLGKALVRGVPLVAGPGLRRSARGRRPRHVGRGGSPGRPADAVDAAPARPRRSDRPAPPRRRPRAGRRPLRRGGGPPRGRGGGTRSCGRGGHRRTGGHRNAPRGRGPDPGLSGRARVSVRRGRTGTPSAAGAPSRRRVSVADSTIRTAMVSR